LVGCQSPAGVVAADAVPAARASGNVSAMDFQLNIDYSSVDAEF
jgi:hypothetical protein